MRYPNIIILVLTCGVHQAISQSGDCFEVKYLDFFGISKMENLKWPESDLDTLLEKDFPESETEKQYKTNFLIPFIMRQLRDYHPACNKLTDTTHYNKLVSLYFKIRQQDQSLLEGKSRTTQLEAIRQDFYDQLLNDSVLPYMVFTMDDGPLYGQSPNPIPTLQVLHSIETDFGQVSILSADSAYYVQATNKRQEFLWTRLMTGTYDRILRDLQFGDDIFTKTSRAYVISMFSEGERLTLYLRLDGSHMYYYHSW